MHYWPVSASGGMSEAGLRRERPGMQLRWPLTIIYTKMKMVKFFPPHSLSSILDNAENEEFLWASVGVFVYLPVMFFLFLSNLISS